MVSETVLPTQLCKDALTSSSALNTLPIVLFSVQPTRHKRLASGFFQVPTRDIQIRENNNHFTIQRQQSPGKPQASRYRAWRSNRVGLTAASLSDQYCICQASRRQNQRRCAQEVTNTCSQRWTRNTSGLLATNHGQWRRKARVHPVMLRCGANWRGCSNEKALPW